MSQTSTWWWKLFGNCMESDSSLLCNAIRKLLELFWNDWWKPYGKDLVVAVHMHACWMDINQQKSTQPKTMQSSNLQIWSRYPLSSFELNSSLLWQCSLNMHTSKTGPNSNQLRWNTTPRGFVLSLKYVQDMNSNAPNPTPKRLHTLQSPLWNKKKLVPPDKAA